MIVLSFGLKTLLSPLKGGSEIIVWPFLKKPKNDILARRPLKKSSNQNVIKIKVLHFDEIYLECGLRIEIKPNLWPPEPKNLFFGFFTI